jgi:hypothetical protein
VAADADEFFGNLRAVEKHRPPRSWQAPLGPLDFARGDTVGGTRHL